MQHRLKAPPGIAGTWIIPAELLLQLLIPMHNPYTSLDIGLRRETFAAFAHDFKSRVRSRSLVCVVFCSSHTSYHLL